MAEMVIGGELKRWGLVELIKGFWSFLGWWWKEVGRN